MYTYLAAVDGIAVRNARRRECIKRDREILVLQNNLRDGRITVREFLVAAAHHFEPLEQEYGEVDVEVLNRPQNKILAAFEALLVAVVEEQEAQHFPAAVAAQQEAEQVPAAAATQQAEPVPAAVAGQQQAEPVPAAVAVQNQAEPVPAAVAAPHEADPIAAAVLAEAPNTVVDDPIIAPPEEAIDGPMRPAVGRRRQRGRPRGRRMAPRADELDENACENLLGRGLGDGRGRGRGRPRVHIQNEDNVRGRNVQRGRLRIRPILGCSVFWNFFIFLTASYCPM